MKHIENNFQKIAGVKIDQSELIILRTFLNELKDNPIIEGILISPTYHEYIMGREDFSDEAICIYIVIDGSKENKIALENDIIAARHILNKKPYFNPYSNNKYNFEIQNKPNYEKNSILMSFAIKDLVSSYIYFDRFGKLEKLQEKFKNTAPWSSLVEIENIDELYTISKTRTLKQKKH